MNAGQESAPVWTLDMIDPRDRETIERLDREITKTLRVLRLVREDAPVAEALAEKLSALRAERAHFRVVTQPTEEGR